MKTAVRYYNISLYHHAIIVKLRHAIINIIIAIVYSYATTAKATALTAILCQHIHHDVFLSQHPATIPHRIARGNTAKRTAAPTV